MTDIPVVKPTVTNDNQPTLILVPRRAGIKAGATNVLEVLVRVQAKDMQGAAQSNRAPQALALVIDRSGSMSGRPLMEAKRCAEYVVSRTRPSDVIALVQFDHRAALLWPATSVGDGTALRDVISSITGGGSTNLHGGWLKGAQALREDCESNFRRIILLSDGCANQGVTDSEEIKRQCAWWASRGITTSTFGLGYRFNEELMIEIAREGGGNGYYAESGEDLKDPFEQELDLLANLAVREVRLSVTAAEGVEVEMVNDLPFNGRHWGLPDIAWGAEAWAMLRVTLPKEALKEIGQECELLRVQIKASNPERHLLPTAKASLSLPVVAKEAWKALQEDELVARRSVEVEAGKALTRLRSLAFEGNWLEVDRLVMEAKATFKGNAWVDGILNSMMDVAASRSRERTMKEALYSSSKLSSRLAAKHEAEFGGEGNEGPAYLRRKSTQGKSRPK